ncbi:MAG: FIST C-terminal domain-containing protein [Treponema sp.]|nr:FIST C-terminal domain-containing protein [Treponema sp.]
MITMLTAYTKELDDIEVACNEIIKRLGAPHAIRKNSVGLITCDSEFVDAGVVEALCKRLDFDIIGITTRGTAVNGQNGFDILSIAALTSDDIRFSTVMSDSITPDSIDAPIEAAYYSGASKYGNEKPSLILAYPPMMLKVGVGQLVAPLRRLSGDDIPVFGTLSNDQTPYFSTCKTICNGKAFPDTFGMVFFFGEVHPQFFRQSISLQNIQKQHAVVTDAEGFLVKTLNDMPFSHYLQRLGFAPQNFETLYMIPFIINLKNNNANLTISCGVYSVTKEGYAVFDEEIPIGATIALGKLDANDVLNTAQDAVTRIADLRAQGRASCALMYSCITRSIILGSNYFAEMNIVSDTLDGVIPFQCCYSGGEICPAPDASGKPANHIHTFTFIVCVLT